MSTNFQPTDIEEKLNAGEITRKTTASNISYILNDNDLFLLTGYKVLKSRGEGTFIPCYKVRHNGKVKLLYKTAGEQSLQNLLDHIEGNTVLQIVVNLFRLIANIRSNGFLSVHNLDMSPEHIFVNPKTLTVKLIYLPIVTPQAEFAVFENKLRTRLIRLMSARTFPQTAETNRVCGYLADGGIDFTELQNRVIGECRSRGGIAQEPAAATDIAGIIHSEQPELTLSAINVPIRLWFSVNTPEFIIGKSAATADGVITFNKAISRVHCKLNFQNGSYFCSDLGSANGTYVNDRRLAPHRPEVIRNGDVIRLANTEFMVRIQE